MKKEIAIPSVAGFCKNCFNIRRTGSSYCGKCNHGDKRITLYHDNNIENFPLLEKVKKQFGIKDTSRLIFTYGNVFYSQNDISYGLIAHEVVHTIQQEKISKEVWWEKYLADKDFRLSQEVEAYRNQYQTYSKRNPIEAESMLNLIAKDLSGKMYGNMISFEEAINLIKNN